MAYGPRIHGLVDNKKDMDNIVEMSLKNAGLWDEVKDRLDSLELGYQVGSSKDYALQEL